MKSESPPSAGLWSLLPPSLRVAGILALVTSIVAGVVVYVSTSDTGPEFSRGGRFGEVTDDRDALDLTIPTPAPRPGAISRPRSSAVLSAPSAEQEQKNGTSHARPKLPTFGTYVYAVEGTEDAPPFGSRTLPPQMTMTVSSSESAGQSESGNDELVFDLEFSDDHEEREIVAYGSDGIAFTYEAESISFGFTHTVENNYDPPIVQIPAKLKAEASLDGTTTALGTDGETTREEDWTVTVEGRETLDILDTKVETWVVRVERESRSGSDEELTRTRRYWFSPAHSIWVKWEETTRSSQDFGPGRFSYEAEFTATLQGIQEL